MVEGQNLSLVTFVRALVERLMLSTDYDRAAVEEIIGGIRADLAAMAEQYQAPAPPGAEAVQELMLEVLDLYDRSMQRILAFLDDIEEDHLLDAVALVEEADDVLNAVEDVIQTNKLILNEMVQA